MGSIVSGIASVGMGIWQANDATATANRQYNLTDSALAYDERMTRLKSQFDITKTRMEGSALAARQRTAFAASGVDPTVGTAAQVQANTVAMKELDAQTQANDAARAVWGYELQRGQAKQNLLTTLGNINRQGAASVLGGAFQMMGGGADIAKQYGGGGGTSQAAGDAAFGAG